MNNKDYLFGTIPPGVWQRAWQLLQSEEPAHIVGGMFFWTGIALAAALDDPDYCDKQFLAELAIMKNVLPLLEE